MTLEIVAPVSDFERLLIEVGRTRVIAVISSISAISIRFIRIIYLVIP